MHEIRSNVSRRGFVAGVGGIAAAGILAGCSTPNPKPNPKASAGTSAPLVLWDMPWGTPEYNPLVSKITDSYAAQGTGQAAQYHVVQWPAETQTFTSALASHTGPDLATSGAWNAVQFADKGFVRYADHLIATLKKTGIYDDFLPGTFDPFSTPKGYVAIPWNVDIRAVWYRKSLFEKAGVAPPTDWNSWLTAGKALKKTGVYAFGTGAGSGNTTGLQALTAMVLNNGGGLFDTAGNPDCVTERNIETCDFIQELVGQGYVDPNSITYTVANERAQWKDKRWAMGWSSPGLDDAVGDTSGDLDVLSPLAGPHGDKGCLYWVNPLMMLETAAKEGDIESFITYFISKWKTIWDSKLILTFPPLKSIADSAAFGKSPTNVKIVKEWQPIAKTTSSLAQKVFPALATIDGGTAMLQWSQTILSGNTSSRAALTTLQQGIESVMK